MSTLSGISGSKRKKIREKILDRDGRACRVCASTVGITIRQVDPALGNQQENLLTVCPEHVPNQTRVPKPAPPKPAPPKPAPPKPAPAPQGKCVCRTHQGQGKKRFKSRADALTGAMHASRAFGLITQVYPCPTTDSWHVRTKRARNSSR